MTQQTPAAPPAQPTVYRRALRDRIQKTRRYWGKGGEMNASELADQLLMFLDEQGVKVADDDWAPRAAVPDTGPPPLDFDVLVRSIVDSRYMWISMENAVDMAVTAARLLVDAGAVRIVADGQPVEVHGSLGAMRRLVHSRGITADERDHDVAVSRPVPPLEGRERDRLREVLDAAGLPRDRGWDDVLLALRSMGARAVPDIGHPAPCQGSCVGCGAAEDQPCREGCACVQAGIHDMDGEVSRG